MFKGVSFGRTPEIAKTILSRKRPAGQKSTRILYDGKIAANALTKFKTPGATPSNALAS
jgi:hypothetical protein